MLKVRQRVKRGVLVTFEGIEGSGKTTQIKAVARWLRKKGLPVLTTREPGGTPLADRIRKILLTPKNKGMNPRTELFLYEVARRDHVLEKIRPAIKRRAVVLCDRFTDASVAYQGFGRGLSLRTIRSLNEAAADGIRPDVTFLFDLPVVSGLRRAQDRGKGLDRLEQEKQAFHEKVRQGYLTLARQEKKRFCILDGKKPRGEIFERIRRRLETIL